MEVRVVEYPVGRLNGQRLVRPASMIPLPEMPNTSAQSSPCGLLIGFPCEGQEIDCRLGA